MVGTEMWQVRAYLAYNGIQSRGLEEEEEKEERGDGEEGLYIREGARNVP